LLRSRYVLRSINVIVAIRRFADRQPQVHPSSFVDETALVIGDAVLAEDSSVWPMAVIRADIHAIRIGKRSNIQDGTVIHVTHAGKYNPDGFQTIVGNEVTVGHRCILHGCTIHDHCLIGMGVCVMDGATVEPQVIIGAGSLVTPGKVLTSGYLWMGAPAKCVRPLTPEEREFLSYSADFYVKLKNRHLNM
jgi:carbonic anhydrase/acetyltransferase-like protein (isoleucine patch superfamily)